MFRSKVSQRDLYLSNPSDHFLGSITQDQARQSQNGSSSGTPFSCPITFSEENPRASNSDWPFMGSYSQRKNNYSNSKQATVSGPFPFTVSNNSENTKFQDLRNEAIQQDIVDMLRIILNNQRDICERQDFKECRNLLTTVLETQKCIISEQKQTSSHHQEYAEILKSVKQPIDDLEDKVCKMIQNQVQESNKIEAAFERNLKVLNDTSGDLQQILQIGQLQDSFDKALREHKHDMQLHFQKQMGIFNMDIIKAFQNQCTRHLERSLEKTISNYFTEYFNKIIEGLQMEFSKIENCQNNIQKTNEVKADKWIEKALAKLESIHSRIDPNCKKPNQLLECNSPKENLTFKHPSNLNNISWVNSNFEEGSMSKGKMCSPQVKSQQVYHSWHVLQNLTDYRKQKPKVPPFKENRGKTKLPKKGNKNPYPLRSATKLTSPDNRAKVVISDLESSPGISCSFMNFQTSAQLLRKPCRQSNRFADVPEKQVPDLKWF